MSRAMGKSFVSKANYLFVYHYGDSLVDVEVSKVVQSTSPLLFQLEPYHHHQGTDGTMDR